MTVQILRTPEGTSRLTRVGYAPLGALQHEDGTSVASVPPAVEAVTVAGALCNDAAFVALVILPLISLEKAWRRRKGADSLS